MTSKNHVNHLHKKRNFFFIHFWQVTRKPHLNNFPKKGQRTQYFSNVFIKCDGQHNVRKRRKLEQNIYCGQSHSISCAILRSSTISYKYGKQIDFVVKETERLSIALLKLRNKQSVLHQCIFISL